MYHNQINIKTPTQSTTNLYLPKTNNNHMTLTQNCLIIQKTTIMPSHSSYSSYTFIIHHIPFNRHIHLKIQFNHHINQNVHCNHLTHLKLQHNVHTITVITTGNSKTKHIITTFTINKKKLKTHSTIKYKLIMIVIG